MALSVEGRVGRAEVLAVFGLMECMARCRGCEGCAEPIAIVAAIGDQFAGERQRGDQLAGTLVSSSAHGTVAG